MKFWLEAATTIVMVALAIWQWCQLYRHPKDLALRPLALGVTAIALLLTLGIDAPPFTYIHTFSNEITNGTWAFLFFCYSVFFLLARLSDTSLDPAPVWRRIRIEFAIYLFFVAVSYIALRGGVDSSWWASRSIERYASFRNWAYYLTNAGFVLILWGVGTVRAIRYLKLLTHRWARVTVVGVVIATGLMAWGVDGISLARQAWYLFNAGERWSGFTTLYNIGRLGGQALLAIALSVAPLLALATTIRERAQGRQKRDLARKIRPLWRTLSAEFPHVALPAASTISAPGPQLDRMMIEVSDGLAYLAPWATSSSTEDDTSVPDEVAAALTNKHSSGQARQAAAHSDHAIEVLPQWEPEFRNWRERADWMAALTRELDKRGSLPKSTSEV
ncbi:DUF6545 domain-containing protein [Pseudonocardia parietis]|uniref:DUF6545 domain-containing protein n=1 Tax=Pseudonocardia parietis TaxID=570936 RepID=A0ABS4W7P1_9PSEU|nr:DUF6545 domain-containing protein [Pseudonocardia parietis]MBP2371963.1 hypothetical protein [Pseudonocardia parietis]